ncbi:hypothetical protein [Frigoribacterium sp. R86507]|uniref:hypothetical protein n=1 Tax=Frigoribacterium sp. R86507 TaxID=3093850 RepID=UPI0037C4FDD2
MTRTYRFSSDPADIDVHEVVSWLSEEAYWARGRTEETHRAAMAGSRNYGAYDIESGDQGGYARALFTEDAHGLYQRFGFEPLVDAGSWMLRWGPGFGPRPPR